MADARLGGLPNGVFVDELRVAIAAPNLRPDLVVNHARATVPQATLDALVGAVSGRAGVNVAASFGDGRVSASVKVALLKVTVAFRPVARNGNLELEPAGGVPGWLLGRLAAIAGNRPGVTVASDGKVTIDPTPLLPSGVRLANGITDARIVGDRMEVIVG